MSEERPLTLDTFMTVYYRPILTPDPLAGPPELGPLVPRPRPGPCPIALYC